MQKPGSPDRLEPDPVAAAEGASQPLPIPIPLIVVDSEGRIRGFSTAVDQVCELSPADLGQPLASLEPRLPEGPPLPDVADLRTSGRPIEHELETKAGRWFLRHVASCRDTAGVFDGMAISFTDITALKQRESDLARSKKTLRVALDKARQGEARFRSVAESAPGLIWMNSPERGCEFVNQAYLDFFGRGLDEVLGFGFMPDAHPDDGEGFFATYFEAVRSHSPFAAEARFRRADGQYRWLLSQGVPRRNESGVVTGYIGSSLDVTDIKHAEAELRETAERLRIALEASQMGDWSWDVASDGVTLSPRAKVILGLPPDYAGSWSGIQALLQPDDSLRVAAGVDAAIAARGGYDVQYRFRRPSDGEDVWISIKGQAASGPESSVRGMIGVLQDITEPKFAEERQRLLIRELHHRVKNTLATVQAIVGSTARTAATIDEFYQAFVGRIVSLAKTHTLLTEHQWQTAFLEELLRNELGPYADERDERVAIEGPPVELTSEAAVPIGMAVHELTTNAAKYGALSAGGRVEVRWALEVEGGRPHLHFTWTERGGPRVEAPQRQGFGSRLLQRVLSTQLHADVRMDFDEQGLTFKMSMPVPKPADPYTSLKPV